MVRGGIGSTRASEGPLTPRAGSSWPGASTTGICGVWAPPTPAP